MKLKLLTFFLLIVFQLFSNEAILKSSFIFQNPPFESCHASTITVTKNSTILISFFAGSKEGEKDVRIWLVAYNNNKYSEPTKIVETDNIPCWNPVLFTYPDGEISLFYKVGKNPEMWSGFLKRSFDDGASWSSEEIFPAGILGPIKNKPILLNGALLCPSSIESYNAWACWIDITKDRGRTWEKSAPIVDPKNSLGIIQPTLFITKKGNIKLLSRSYTEKKIFTAISIDKAKNFTKAKFLNLSNPNSGIDCVKLKNEDVLLVYNDSTSNRYPLSIAISKNDGKSFKKILDLEKEEGEFSYPSIIQTQDGLVHITYTWNRKNIKHVILDPKLL
ncbi:MAG: exo-alpha-sialidase [Chlamydiae bacterium]|nr:exo-alpha-sialidase [Chlamydiota bacterium]